MIMVPMNMLNIVANYERERREKARMQSRFDWEQQERKKYLERERKKKANHKI